MSVRASEKRFQRDLTTETTEHTVRMAEKRRLISKE
jgi:hypothetical protein